jgi:hypothetical protein
MMTSTWPDPHGSFLAIEFVIVKKLDDNPCDVVEF